MRLEGTIRGQQGKVFIVELEDGQRRLARCSPRLGAQPPTIGTRVTIDDSGADPQYWMILFVVPSAPAPEQITKVSIIERSHLSPKCLPLDDAGRRVAARVIGGQRKEMP